MWQMLLKDRSEITTEGGELVKVIYPGRANDDRGADFRDAVVATKQGLRHGDIEVHVKSSNWWTHQHHKDPIYNRVILHVVMWHDDNSVCTLNNGGVIPIVTLGKYVGVPSNLWFDELHPPVSLSVPCARAAECRGEDILAKFLDSAGEKRFFAKTAGFQSDLAQMEADQVFYRGIMGALGYSRNKIPFMELADRVPLRVLESIARDRVSDEDCLAYQQALLLGVAGLLPSKRQNKYRGNSLHNDSWIDRLERLWSSLAQTEVMSPDVWHLFRVRPSNSPIRRIVAMSYIVLRYRKKGMFEEIINLIRETPESNGYNGLEEGLMVIAGRNWASYCDFDVGTRVDSLTLLGRRRVADIIVNILLPFAFAWGKFISQMELERKAFDLYRSCPKLAVNSVVRHMRDQLGLSNNLVDSAQRQQGLIHIYNTLCSQGRCNCCPLGEKG